MHKPLQVFGVAFVLGFAAAFGLALRPADPPNVRGLILSVSSATAGDTSNMAYSPSTEGLWQVEITGTATCILKGRIQSTAPWVTIATRTASGGDIVPIFPDMQAECTSYTSGTVKAWLASRPN